MNNEIRTEIAEIIKLENKRPIPAGIIVKKILNKNQSIKKHQIYQTIEKMIFDKELKKTHSGSLVENYIDGNVDTSKKYTGIIRINSVLDGYIKVDDPLDDLLEVYVNNRNLKTALNFDKVSFYLTDKISSRNIKHAVVDEIIERNKEFYVGTFKLIGNTYEVVLDDVKNYSKIKLDNIDNLVNNHKILIKIEYYKNNRAYASVAKIIGHINDVGSEILSIVYEHNINPEFEQKLLDFTNKIKEDDNYATNRIDITDRKIITIDPVSSKDLDDAIYVKKNNDHYFLSVSIADVSNYVQYKSILDEHALNTSTSVYLVDRVIPMLPHYLSNDVCSLNPNEFKYCMTCDVKIDFSGNIQDIDVYASKIKSVKRFSYDEVNQYYDKLTSFSDDLNKMLDVSYELHKILRTKKNAEGYIDFEIKEPLIIVDEKCVPTDIQIKKRGTAQMMIEDFMVVANEAVTIKAEQNKMPFIYRIHDMPSLEKLNKLYIEAKKLGFKINPDEFANIQPKTLTKWINQNADNPNRQLINKLMLRCMAKARYSTKNNGHFGLALKNYTHFTSPIRRYPDLIVHRLYKMYLLDYNNYTDQQRQEFKNSLAEMCEICTENEINAVNCERDVNKYKFCEYLAQKINQEFDGVISTIRSFGMYIELENTIEGLVRLKNIQDDYYCYDEVNNSIYGKSKKRIFNYGDKVRVKVLSVDMMSKQINFEIVG